MDKKREFASDVVRKAAEAAAELEKKVLSAGDLDAVAGGNLVPDEEYMEDMKRRLPGFEPIEFHKDSRDCPGCRRKIYGWGIGRYKGHGAWLCLECGYYEEFDPSALDPWD